MKAINIHQPKVKGRVIIRVDFEFGTGERFYAFGDALAEALLDLKSQMRVEPEDFEFSVHPKPPHVSVEVAPWVHDANLPERIWRVIRDAEVPEE